MDFSVTRDDVKATVMLLDTVADHPVDCDIILPDYCPDISRVLKTEAGVSVEQKVIDPGRLTVNGTFFVRVIYMPENTHAIRCVSHETPYSHSFELAEAPGKSACSARARVVYVNCRPVGPRRLSIRGSVAISARVKGEQEVVFISGVEDERVETLCKPMSTCAFVGAADKVFDIQEELELGYGKPAAAAVIRAEAVAVVSDYKLISKKIIAKGEVLLKTLYSPEDDEDGGSAVEVMEHSLPLSQILDLENVDDGCICDLRLAAGPPHIEIKADANGENRIFAVSLTVTATAEAYRRQPVNIVVDAYSPQYEMQLKQGSISFEDILDTVKSSQMIRQTVELQDMNLGSVCDIGAGVRAGDVKFSAGGMDISGDMYISILAVDAQSGPVSIEKSLPFTVHEELKNRAENMRCEPDVKVVSVSYSLIGPDRIDLRVECSVEAVVYAVMNETAVVDMKLDDSKPKNIKPAKVLTLYYADGGERLWDIAKRYNTSMEAIKRENNIEADQLEARSMLLIPRKRLPKK